MGANSRLVGKRLAGMTFVELLLASTIIGILSLAVASFFRHATADSIKISKKVRATQEIRTLSEILRLDLFRVVDVWDASPTSFTVVFDSAPFFNPTLDYDWDGLPNRVDPDVDGDRWVIPTSTNQAWRVGNNRDDDDDNNDGKVDIVCRYRLDGNRIKRLKAINTIAVPGSSVTGAEEVVAKSVSRFEVFYEGTALYEEGRSLDLAPRDQIVTPLEIDSGFVGNHDGIPFNTREERGAIGIFIVRVGIDIDEDGVEDGQTDFSVAPPLLPMKRKY